MATFSDQLGQSIMLSSPPKRIVSLVPSQTELLSDLGLDAEIAGITKFCIHPEHWRKSKTIVGGTKNFHFDIIDGIAPDLIIGNKEENYKEGIQQLQSRYPVWMSDIVLLEDALRMIASVGELTSKTAAASAIVDRIEKAFRSLTQRPPSRVLYLIWRNPWMGAGSDTFIHTIIEKIGWTNCLEAQPRYPELTSEDIRSLDPEIVLLSSEPYPFGEKHRAELNEIVPEAKTILVDGEMFSWYGSRLVHAPAYFNSLTL
jgi:ABC-type Fe3+-hydroxamate transport system substrate-binding protein